MALKTLQNDQLVVNWSLPQIDDASDEGSTSACSTCWQASTRRWTRWVGAHAHAHHTVAHDVAEVGLGAEEDDPVADVDRLRLGERQAELGVLPAQRLLPAARRPRRS